MNFVWRLFLCLAIVLAGVPMTGIAGAGTCCAQPEGKGISCCTPSSQSTCCCTEPSQEKAEQGSVPGCCEKPVEKADAPVSSPSNEVRQASHPGCGGDQCPCSTQRCCGQVSPPPVLYFSLMTRPHEVVSVFGLSVADDEQLTRADRPLVPPPKVPLAL